MNMADTKVENMFETLVISEYKDEEGSEFGGSDEVQSQPTDFAYNTPPDSPGRWSLSSLTLLNEDAGADATAADDYFGPYRLLVEQDLAFDHEFRNNEAANERTVEGIFHKIKHRDAAKWSHKAGPNEESQSQFNAALLSEKLDHVEKREMFKIIQKMPKGAHLHIHFNTYLPPKVLLDIAKSVDLMFITSNLPLLSKDDFEEFVKCDIAFSILTPDKEKPGSLFEKGSAFEHTMKLSTFVEKFPQVYTKVRGNIDNVDSWLLSKLSANKTEVDKSFQPTASECYWPDGCARTVQGLLKYAPVFKRYTRLCLEDFLQHNVQYTEIRLPFKVGNVLQTNGIIGLSNSEAMEIIIGEVNRFQDETAKRGEYFGGLKIIYCTSRSADPSNVEIALAECLEFKKRWPDWIAGFDLVCEEVECRPLRYFASQLLRFQEDCGIAGVEIPFLFHCGGAIEDVAEADGNLMEVVEALLLGSKRIAHGFELSKSKGTIIMEYMKKNGICVELCPMSNHNSALASSMDHHLIYQLLGNNVHCTTNFSDGTLLRSSLSHGFIEFVLGKPDTNLNHVKKLIVWSIEHACLGKAERWYMMEKWKILWGEFLLWVIETYDGIEFEGFIGTV